MPLVEFIDRDRRLVVARASGTLTYSEMIEYQRRVWSRPDVVGFDELIDVSDVRTFDQASPGHAASVAKLAASMDADAPPAKLAIVAPGDLGYGLSRQYQVLRMSEGPSKIVGVFRTREEADAFLHPTPFPADRLVSEPAAEAVR